MKRNLKRTGAAPGPRPRKSKLEQARLDEADAQQKQQVADALSLHERQQLEKEKREQKLVDLDWKKNNTNTAGNVLNSAGLKYQKQPARLMN